MPSASHVTAAAAAAEDAPTVSSTMGAPCPMTSVPDSVPITNSGASR